eukprot:evm.model.NODE_26797_length_23647_cov_22.651287.6
MAADSDENEAPPSTTTNRSSSLNNEKNPPPAMTLAQQQQADDDAKGFPKNRFSHGITKLWHIPPSLKTGKPVKLGIDEAGRGPVMGPMVYAAAFWKVEEDAAMIAMGFDDSKALDEKTRDGLFQRMLRTHAQLGWVIHSIPATELAVGDPEMYQKKLEGLFAHHSPRISFVVAKKADSLYKTVSAASIAAKVTRDRAISGWVWEEGFQGKGQVPLTNFGSGYPGDARCSEWLKGNSDGVFGFPSLVRFSWSTARDLMEKECVKVEWEEDEDDRGGLPAGTASIEAFIRPKPGAPKKARKRAKYFQTRGVETVGDF